MVPLFVGHDDGLGDVQELLLEKLLVFEFRKLVAGAGHEFGDFF